MNLLPILLLVTGVQALATLAVLSLATLAPAVSESFGVGTHFVGYQVSFIYVSGACISLVAGGLVVRWGAIATSQVAMLLCGIGVLGLASGNLAVLVAGSLLIGAGYGLTNPAASHLLFKVAPAKHRNLLFSLKQTAVPVGGVIAGLLLPALTAHAGWQAALLASVGLSLLLLIILNGQRRRFDGDRKPSHPLRKNLQYGLRMLFLRKDLLRLSIMAFCFSATQLSLMSFAVSLLVHDLAKTLIIAGTVASLIQGCGACGRIFWGAIADRCASGIPILITIGVLSTLSSLAMTAVNQHWPFMLVIGLLCLYGTCSIGWNGVFLAEVARISSTEEVSSMTGMVLCFTFLGVVVGPSCFAVCFSLLHAYTITYGVMAIFPALGTMVLLNVRRRPTAQQPADQAAAPGS